MTNPLNINKMDRFVVSSQAITQASITKEKPGTLHWNRLDKICATTKFVPNHIAQFEGMPLHVKLVQHELNGGAVRIVEIAQLKDQPEVRYLIISGLDNKTLGYLVAHIGHQLLGLDLWKCQCDVGIGEVVPS
jgi:hypothetical protein